MGTVSTFAKRTRTVTNWYRSTSKETGYVQVEFSRLASGLRMRRSEERYSRK
jgi:hypothetical protein